MFCSHVRMLHIVSTSSARSVPAGQAVVRHCTTGLQNIAWLSEVPVHDVLVSLNSQGLPLHCRFRKSDRFSDLFSFVDVSSAPDFRPDSYKLVTQFPRRAFDSTTPGTLQEAGLTQKQEALFLEPL